VQATSPAPQVPEPLDGAAAAGLAAPVLAAGAADVTKVVAIWVALGTAAAGAPVPALALAAGLAPGAKTPPGLPAADEGLPAGADFDAPDPAPMPVY